MHQQESQAGRTGPQPGLGVLLLLLQAFAVVAEVFLHKRIGRRYLDKQAALALLVIPGFVLVWPEEDPRPLLYLLVAFALRCAVLRLQWLRRRTIDVVEHTRYSGWPAILDGRLGNRLSEPTAKSVVEPLLVFFVGAVFCELSKPLGSFGMVSAVCLLVTAKTRLTFERSRIMDLRDAQIDQRNLSEHLRRRDW